MQRKENIDLEQPVEISFEKFTNFVFDVLWGKYGLVFHDTKEELEQDIDLLSKLGIVAYNKRSKNITINFEHMKLLTKIAEGMQKDPMRTKIKIIDEYLATIEKSIV
jgi:hypothetical protein